MDTQRDPAIETVLLGGGCFWCTEAVFRQVRGVLDVESGYAGGQVPQPTYEAVCDGTTGHAEVVRVRFDPQQIAFDDVLRIFFATHDPTTLNRQGADVGTQYRSAIFCSTPAQQAIAARVIDEQDGRGPRGAADRAFDAPIVTQLEGPAQFWPAEPYHANYFEQHPGQGYCAVVIAPKLAKFRRQFDRHLRDRD